MTITQAKSITAELLEKSPNCYLTTINEQKTPEIRSMLNLRYGTMFPGLQSFFRYKAAPFDIYLTTNTSSVKMDQIRRNPEIAVYFADAVSFKGSMLAGRAEIILDQQTKENLWQSDWKMYYPLGVTDPDYTVIRLAGQKIKVYHNLGTCTLTDKDLK